MKAGTDEATAGRADRGEMTRRALIKAARELFSERGFAQTPTEDIIRRAGASRGAMYHHFRDKKDLFASVFEEIESHLAEEIASAAAGAGDPITQIRHGIDVFLDRCLDPDVQRIALLDAPSVLGWERWQEIDEKYAFGLVTAGLQAAIDAGAIPRQPVEPLAYVVMGSLTQAGMALARADDPGRQRKLVGAAVHHLIRGLQSPP